MAHVALPSRPQDNRLFAALPPAEAARLLPVLEPVTWALRDVLYAPDEAPEFLYFPTTAMVSLIHTLTDGITAEMGVVGREGVVGVALFMGGGSTASEALVQIAGQGFRLPAVYVGGEFRRGGVFQEVLLRYAQALLTQIGQTAVCNMRHTITQRMCRWLLLALDRVPGDEVRMTQEFLAQMLAVRRPSVTEVARRMQTAGLIRCGRGYITIVNRREVEARVCECYATVEKEFTRLLGEA
jgi:CRP-like cAMP-binding protein